MADQQFEILIKYGLDPTNAKKAAGELRGVEEQAKKTGEEGTKQADNVTKATEKTINTKKGLREAVKGLAYEFPLLGRAAALATNPISGAVAGIIGAFTIWRKRVDELTKSLGGVALPDINETTIDRIDRFAEKLKKVGDNSKAAVSRLKEIQDLIDLNADFWKALGVDVGTGPAQAKADAASAAAAQLQASGKAKADAGVAVTPEQLAQAKSLADAAAQDNVLRRERLFQIDEDQNLGRYDPRRIYYDNRFRARYGNGTTYAEARGIEQAAMANNQNVIGFYSNITARAALRSAGTAELNQAQGILGQNVMARGEIRNAAAADFSAAAAKVANSGIAELPQNFATLFQTLMRMNELAIQFNQEAANRARLNDQLNQ